MNEVQHTFGRSGQRRKLALRLAETAKHFWDLGFTCELTFSNMRVGTSS